SPSCGPSTSTRPCACSRAGIRGFTGDCEGGYLPAHTNGQSVSPLGPTLRVAPPHLLESHMSRRSALAALGASGLLLLSGCGGAPTAGPAPGSDQPTAAEAVYAEVGALSGTERRDRLVPLAAEEGNKLSIYTSLNGDIADIVVTQFEQATGVDVDVYRADSETVLQRTLQEAQAGFAGADVVETNATQMAIIADQGLTGDYRSEY